MDLCRFRPEWVAKLGGSLSSAIPLLRGLGEVLGSRKLASNFFFGSLGKFLLQLCQQLESVLSRST